MNAQSNGAPSLPDFVPVIIIGAGPAGITAATLLAQYGIECLVLDRHETAYPLPRAVLGRIVRDEAAHGTFGFAFLDWALPMLSEDDRTLLGEAADRAIRVISRQWDSIRSKRSAEYDESVGDALGWMQTDAYLELATRSMQSRVREPLISRGIPLSA